MNQSRGLNHIALTVKDVQNSLKFYQKAFGLEIRFWEGPSMVFLKSSGASDWITLQQAKRGEATGPGGGIAHIGFELKDKNDLDRAVQEVVAAGGSLIERGEHHPGLAYAYIADPDGYIIEL